MIAMTRFRASYPGHVVKAQGRVPRGASIPRRNGRAAPAIPTCRGLAAARGLGAKDYLWPPGRVSTRQGGHFPPLWWLN